MRHSSPCAATCPSSSLTLGPSLRTCPRSARCGVARRTCASGAAHRRPCTSTPSTTCSASCAVASGCCCGRPAVRSCSTQEAGARPSSARPTSSLRTWRPSRCSSAPCPSHSTWTSARVTRSTSRAAGGTPCSHGRPQANAPSASHIGHVSPEARLGIARKVARGFTYSNNTPASRTPPP